MMTVD